MIKKIKRLVRTIYNIDKKIDEIQLQNIELMRRIDILNNEYKQSILELKKEITKPHEYTNLELIPYISNSNKKKILIIGFYGAFNLGDELMLETILDKLNNKKMDITVMLCENQNTDITEYPGCHFIHYPKTLLDLNRIASSYDIFLFGGGALLDDTAYEESGNNLTLSNILINLSMRALAFNKELLLYGLSCNKEFTNKEYIKKLDYIAENATYFSLRDTNSLKVFKKYNINTDNIEIVDDIVISNLNILKESKIKANKKNIGIIYICNENNYEGLKKITKILIENKELENPVINFIPFYSYCNNDVNMYNRLKQELNYKNINIYDYKNNMTEIVDVIKEQNIIISMRYHGILISNLLNKKVINLKYDEHQHYDNKINYIYEKYGFKNNELLFSQYNEKLFKEKLLNYLNEKNKDVNTKKLIENSEKEFKKFIENYINCNQEEVK